MTLNFSFVKKTAVTDSLQGNVFELISTMKPTIRKFVTFGEEVLVEGYKEAAEPWRLFAVAAVISNPWTGRYVEDLKPEILAFGPVLGEALTTRIIDLAGGGDNIEAYGKAAVVGLEGEIEHASALIHTCLLYTSPSPRDRQKSRMPSSA